jgi:hypothetical protein
MLKLLLGLLLFTNGGATSLTEIRTTSKALTGSAMIVEIDSSVEMDAVLRNHDWNNIHNSTNTCDRDTSQT